jgi:hypothetical protein
MNQQAITAGSLADFLVILQPNAAPGAYPMTLSNVIGTSPAGTIAAVAASDGVLTIQTGSSGTAPQTPHPAFFAGEIPLNSGVYSLTFPNGNLFGSYSYVASTILYHFDMGYEAFVSGSGTVIYLYDFTTAHWFYSNASLFPYLFDFTLNEWIYYASNTTNPGHYTANPRYFVNLTTGQVFTM